MTLKSVGTATRTKRWSARVLLAGAAIALVYTGILLWTNWFVDGQAFQDRPPRAALAVARFAWQYSPALDRARDAERARKLSWWNVTTIVNNRERKKFREILTLLAREETELFRYYMRHWRQLSEEDRDRIVIQAVIYANRAVLYSNVYPYPRILRTVQRFADRPAQVRSQGLKEEWFRELMIAHFLGGDSERYQANRLALIQVLDGQAATAPLEMRTGIIAFYDGVLQCVAKQPIQAKESLRSVENSFAKYPAFMRAFGWDNLNVLAISAAMQEQTVCKPTLFTLLSNGGSHHVYDQ